MMEERERERERKGLDVMKGATWVYGKRARARSPKKTGILKGKDSDV